MLTIKTAGIKRGQNKGARMVEIEYYKNGNVMYEIPHKNGKRHGVEKGYHENGNAMYEITNGA